MLLADIEKLLGVAVAGTAQEPIYEARLNAAKDYAREYCRKQFVDGNGADAFPMGVKFAVALLVKSMGESQNVQSQSLGDMSKSFFEGSTAKEAKKYLKPYVRVYA